jgi:hypothetical protein
MFYRAKQGDITSVVEVVGAPVVKRGRYVVVTEGLRDYLPAINQTIDRLIDTGSLKDQMSLYGLYYYDGMQPVLHDAFQ